MGGLLGYLCDTSNVFVINTLHINEDDSLVVGFTDANSEQPEKVLKINSSGVFKVDIKGAALVLDNAAYGITSWYESGGGTSAALATVLKNLSPSQMVIFYDSTNVRANSKSTMLFFTVSDSNVLVVYSSSKLGSVSGVGNVCPINTLAIDLNTNEYHINAD